MRILLVEDEVRMAQALCELLRLEKYEVDHFADGSQGLTAIESNIYDIVILDVMLPNMNGYEIAKRVRENKITTPILMLTAKSELDDKVAGLDSGADDYLTKPFGNMELYSRIRALLRRTDKSSMDKILRVGDVMLDTNRHSITVGNETIALTCKEFDLLALLMRNQGLVLSREQILQSVWGYNYVGESRTVDVHIRMLRSKLGNSGNMIETVRGVGYCFSNLTTEAAL